MVRRDRVVRDWIEVNGAALRFEFAGLQAIGTRIPVVLVHEMGGSLESWDDVVAGLPDVPFLRYDQRGAGLSEKVAASGGDAFTAISLDTVTADLVALLDALTIKVPVVLAGAALGAAVCLHHSLTHPDRTRGLVLSSPAPGGANEAGRTRMRAWIEAVRRGGMREITDAMFAVTYPPELRADQARFERHRLRWLTQDPESFMAVIGMTLSFDLMGRLPEIRCPSLVIGCLQDGVRPAARTAELARLMPGASYVEAASGHYMPLQQPELFAGHLQAFLRTLEADIP